MVRQLHVCSQLRLPCHAFRVLYVGRVRLGRDDGPDLTNLQIMGCDSAIYSIELS